MNIIVANLDIVAARSTYVRSSVLLYDVVCLSDRL